MIAISIQLTLSSHVHPFPFTPSHIHTMLTQSTYNAHQLSHPTLLGFLSLCWQPQKASQFMKIIPSWSRCLCVQTPQRYMESPLRVLGPFLLCVSFILLLFCCSLTLPQSKNGTKIHG